MKKLLTTTLLLLFAVAFPLAKTAMSADYLMAIGAGGEGEKADTIFDQGIKNLAGYIKRSPGIQANVAFNGGHSITEGIIKNDFPASVGKSNFLATDYQRLIQTYKTKLENNEMVAGDQFMIYIDSHGAQKQSEFKTHSISTSATEASDLNTLAGAQVVDLDQLEVLKNLAKKKGVKMAIIDASCHSGNTLALADDNTCVISGTGPNHYGYGTFSQNFLNAMKKGKNLEDVFLETRAMDDTPAFPMISTQAGLTVNAAIYDKITPFLYHFDEQHDKLMPYLTEHNSQQQMCIDNQNYNSLLDTINSIENLNTVTKKVLWWDFTIKEVDLSNLKNRLEDYKNSQDKIALQMRELDLDRLKAKERIDVGDFIYTLTLGDMLNSDYDKLISQMNDRIAKEENPSIKKSLLSTLSFYTQTKARKEEILKANPDLSSIGPKQEELKKTIDSNYFTAGAIAREERKLYSALYNKESQNQSSSQANPCRDFKIQ